MKNLFVAGLLVLAASVCAFPADDVATMVQFQNQGTVLQSFRRFSPLNCSSGLTCSVVNGVMILVVGTNGALTLRTAGSLILSIRSRYARTFRV